MHYFICMMKKPTLKFLASFVFIITSLFHVQATQASETLYAAIREGRAIAIMRHAIAPGGGDPSAFKLGDCSTQRNLSQEGRNQAKRIGEAFKANSITEPEIISSQWCRCVDTANLLGLGTIAELPALNSFFEARQLGPGQTEELRKYLTQRTSNKPLILVTHQVNITGLTGKFASSGEAIVFTIDAQGEVTVLGSLL